MFYLRFGQRLFMLLLNLAYSQELTWGHSNRVRSFNLETNAGCRHKSLLGWALGTFPSRWLWEPTCTCRFPFCTVVCLLALSINTVVCLGRQLRYALGGCFQLLVSCSDMTLLTIFKLLIETELTLHATILFPFRSLSCCAHWQLVAYLRMLTDGADYIFIQQIYFGIDAFLQLLILLSKTSPPYRAWWLTSCQNRLALNISSVISYPETVFVGLCSWLTDTGHLGYPDTVLGKFHVGDALHQILQALRKRNRRLNNLLLSQ